MKNWKVTLYRIDWIYFTTTKKEKKERETHFQFN